MRGWFRCLTALTACSAALVSCVLLTDTDGLSGGAPSQSEAGASDASTGADSMVTDGGGSGDAGGDATTGGCEVSTDPDLVGYWPFDEVSGTTVKDCSGHGHDGIVLSAPPAGPFTTQGHRGGALSGNGAQGCVDLGTPADLSIEGIAFTATAWVYVEAFTTNTSDARYVLGRTQNVATNGWRLAADLGGVYSWTLVPANGSRIDLNSPPSQLEKTWRHLAVTVVPSGAMTLYGDGVPLATGAAPASIAIGTGATVRIGCRGDDGLVFNGRIDEVRIYRRALTQAEITTLAQK